MRPLVCAGLAVGLLVAGCGGGGPGTRHEFTHDASRICRHANQRVSGVDVASISEGRRAARGIGRVVAILRDELERLRELEPPKRDVATVDKWLAVVDQLVDEADAVRAALHAGRNADARTMAIRAAILDERARDLAREYDLAPCRLRPSALGV